MIQYLRLVLYSTIFSLYFHALVEDWRRYLNDDVFRILGSHEHHMFGGRTKYLTFLDLNLQTFYFLLMSILTLSQILNLKMKLLRKFCNFLYVSLVFPIGAFVFLSFWSIYSVDRELIWPKRIEAIVPIYQNHIRHTLPLFGVLIDNFLSQKNYKNSLLKSYSILVVSTIIYTSWLVIIKYKTNVWAYPVLEVMNNTQICLFFASFHILIGFLFLGGKYIDSFLWKSKDSSFDEIKKNF